MDVAEFEYWLGAIAALVSNFTLVVERSAEEPEKKTEAPPS